MQGKVEKRIVVTGGPCSGKSTLMERIKTQLHTDYQILIDNESATDLISGGISPATLGMYEFQKYVITLQLTKEKLFDNAAAELTADKVVLFIDRGILDDKGYVSDEEFTQILSKFDVTEEEILRRYDLVIHLSTAAKNDPKYYRLDNNEARYEDIDGAIQVDDMLLKSWSAHPNRVIIESDEDFDKKMERALKTIHDFLEA